MRSKKGIWIVFAVLLLSCAVSPENDGFYVFSQVYDFKNGTYQWQGDFADYPVEDSTFYELKFDHADLPANLGSGKSLMLSGNNHSDDLFMFLKKKITNLSPNTEYAVSFEVNFATNAAKNSVGAGGSPGESVFLKAGAFHEEPKKVAKEGYYTMNLDKGNQSSRGDDMVVIGTIASSYTDGVDYALETLNNITSLKARSNQNGELWVIVGTDSGFEGTSTIYYTEISLVLTRSE